MAEVKNAFIKSKMNKDLDSRLLPSGEYRNALNAQVSKSEGSDVGALENVLGNELLTNFGLSVSNLSSIGYYSDEVNSIIYVFLTDNNTSSYVPTGAGSNHYVISYNASINTSAVLVTGAFLNFSKLNPIFGVNLIEDLLFWTDNRNQPRKINVISAVTTGYYSTEDNISVAKYNPYESIELYEASSLSVGDYESTMKDVFNIAYPDGGTTKVDGTQTGTTINITNTDILITGAPAGGQVVKKVNVLGEPVDFSPQVTVSTSSTSTSTTLYVNSSITVNDGETLVFDANPYYIPNYKGDPKFLEDKFVRFSYRFKFNDGEYSILAPFTQPCFIPKQDGYFLNNTSTEGDEEQAFSSTIVDFMENKVNKIDLKIPLPSSVANINSDLHVEEIDIVYKESDGLAVQVVESIPYANNNFGASSADSLLDVFTYEYESQIPYKTLPSEEITRVYDKVPVKALSQEIISNRIVYGNYQDKHTPPAFLSYSVSSSIKEDFNLKTGVAESAAQAAYSAGDSIPIINSSGTIIVGSLVTSVYPNDTIPAGTKVTETDGSTTMKLSEDVSLVQVVPIDFNLPSNDSNNTGIIEYPSSSLKTNRNYQVGFVLSDKFGRQSTVILSKNEQTATSLSNSTVFAPYEESNPIEWIGNSLKVSVNDPIGTSPNNALNEPGVYNGDVADENYNPLGWYSYKVVVKQVEQDYYNVYSAGAMKGLPYNYDTNNITPVLSENTSFITLLNDNINKIPRDLSEVGPQDKTFRSSVELYGRVQNTSTSNEQFYPERRSFTTSSVEDLFGLFDVQDFKGKFDEVIPITNPLNAFHGFFKSDSDPFIAEISTSQNSGLQFGVNNSYTAVAGSGDASNNGTSVPTVTLNGTTVTGSIHTGSLLLSINGNGVDGVYVVSVTTDTNPIVTFNQNVSYSPNNTFVFSQQDFNDINTLAVFETKPVTSRLDIFWETSSSGLITDLNDLVLNSSNAGAGFSSWNDSAFQENIILNSNILSQDFLLVDNFGNPITLAAGDNFYISSILDNETPTSTNAFNWFELYEPSGAGNGYNIRITQDFVDNVYFSATSGSNDFNFSFTSYIGGVTTSYNQVANLTNIPPIMIGPLGPDSQDPAISYSTIASTTPSIINNFTATNGANPAGQNEGKDITWSVTATSNGIDASSYFGVSVSNFPEISVCSLRNVATNGAPTGIYDIKLRCTDAGGAFQEITITAQLGVVPVRVTNYVLKYNNGTIENPSFNFSPVCLIEVDNAPDPGSTNGFYAINGSWNTISNGVTTIDLKQIDSGTGGTWFYGTTKTLALNQWRSSFTNDFPRSFSADSATTSAAVSNSATIPLDNINGRLQTGLIVSGVGISAGTTVSSLFQSGDGNTVGSITVNANQTIADNVDIRIGDIPSSVYLTYGFEVIT